MTEPAAHPWVVRIVNLTDADGWDVVRIEFATFEKADRFAARFLNGEWEVTVGRETGPYAGIEEHWPKYDLVRKIEPASELADV